MSKTVIADKVSNEKQLSSVSLAIAFAKAVGGKSPYNNEATRVDDREDQERVESIRVSLCTEVRRDKVSDD